MSSVRNITTDKMLATKVSVARKPWERMIGFIGRTSIEPDEGLWFDRCWAVHTVGVRTPLDILFLDRHGRVVDMAVGVPPSRWAVTCPHAYSVLELGCGAIASGDVLIGDQITLV